MALAALPGNTGEAGCQRSAQTSMIVARDHPDTDLFRDN
jgi:hypothetical protein